MKATGIVRRIDDLGRVVIPERNTADFTDQGRYSSEDFYRQRRRDYFKKIFPYRELSIFAKEYVEALAQTTPFLPVSRIMIRWLRQPVMEAEKLQEKRSAKNWRRKHRGQRSQMLPAGREREYSCYIKPERNGRRGNSAADHLRRGCHRSSDLDREK